MEWIASWSKLWFDPFFLDGASISISCCGWGVSHRRAPFGSGFGLRVCSVFNPWPRIRSIADRGLRIGLVLVRADWWIGPCSGKQHILGHGRNKDRTPS